MIDGAMSGVWPRLGWGGAMNVSPWRGIIRRGGPLVSRVLFVKLNKSNDGVASFLVAGEELLKLRLSGEPLG